MMRSLFQHRLPFPRSALLALLVSAAFGGPACAEPPDAPLRCILLRNGNVLEGKPVQEGDSITILIGKHQSLRLPANQVLCWADDRLQLYRYRLEHRTKSDLLTHLEAARWCIRENLFQPASAELEAARAIDGEHPRISRLQAVLHAARQQPQAKANPTERSAETKQPSHSETKTDQSGAEPAGHSTTTLARLSRSTVADYASRVQPILINRCGQAGCHGGHDTQQTDWQLTLPPSRQHGRLSAEMTRGNLHDLVSWIDQNEPHLSPLLRKASASHAGTQDAPLGPADDDALAELERWIAAVAIELRAEGPRDAPPLATFPSGSPGIRSGPLRPMPETIRGGEPPHRANGMRSNESPRPKRLPPVENPFDPQVFNRLHPRDSSAAGSQSGS